uniref:hypothetical protein n=1 Tax=Burkholderia pyrrocinia TaxID=60550 RepID=UPI0035C726CC
MSTGTFDNCRARTGLVDEVIRKKLGVSTYPAMSILLLDQRTVALANTHINADSSAEQAAEFTAAALAPSSDVAARERCQPARLSERRREKQRGQPAQDQSGQQCANGAVPTERKRASDYPLLELAGATDCDYGRVDGD